MPSPARASAVPTTPTRDILAGMLRLHEEFTVEELEVVARYLDALKDVR